MTVGIYNVLLAEMQLVKFVKTKSGFCEEFASHPAFVSLQEKFADTPAQESSQTETVQQLPPTVPSNTSNDVDFRYGHCTTKSAQRLSIVCSCSYVVSLLTRQDNVAEGRESHRNKCYITLSMS